MSETATKALERIANVIDSVQPELQDAVLKQAAAYAEGMAAMANLKEVKQNAGTR